MMNIYNGNGNGNGNVTTDASGKAEVELPEYFEALNRDPRYQVTVIGSPGDANIATEINDNHFTIQTEHPNVKVSWQVTGIRRDAYAREHPIIVEEEKAIASAAATCIRRSMGNGRSSRSMRPSYSSRLRTFQQAGLAQLRR